MTTAKLRLPTNLYRDCNLILTLTRVSTNEAANTSIVNVKVEIERVNNTNDNFYGNAKIQIYETNSSWGNRQSISATSGRSWDIRRANSTTSIMASTDFIVTHNSDGNRTFYVEVIVDPNASEFSWTADENQRLRASISLPKISRAATLSVPSSVTAGSAFTATISGASGQQFDIVMDGKTISSMNTSTSRSITIGTDVVSSVQSVSKTLTLNTYVGGSRVGSTYATLQVNAPASSLKPTVSNAGSYEDLKKYYNNIFGATSTNQLFGGKSELRITGITGSSTYSSITNYKVQLRNSSGAVRANANSSNGTVNFGVLYNPPSTEVVDIYVAVVDRNGAESSWVKQGSFYNHRYLAPTVSGTAKRDSSNKGAVTFSITTTQLKLNGTSSNQDKNPVTSIVAYKASNETQWSTLSPISGTGNKSITTANSLSTTRSYEFKITVTDKLSTIVINLNSIGTEAVPLDLAPIGAGIGKIHSGDGANLQVGSSGINTEGNIYVNGEYSPKQLERNTNLNNITKPNFYFCPLNADTITMSNRPTDKAFTLQVYRHAGVLQVLTEFETSNARMFMRNQYNGSWGSWTLVNASQPNMSNYYTKSETYAKSEVYTKGDVYTQTQSNSRYQEKFSMDANINANSGYGRIGRLMYCFGVIDINVLHSSYTLKSELSFPRAFSVTPNVFLTLVTDISGANASKDVQFTEGAGYLYVRQVNRESFTAGFSYNNFKAGSSRKAMYFAIGA